MSKKDKENKDKEETKDLILELQTRGYTVTREPIKTGGRYKADFSRWNGKSYQFAVVADTHLCSKYQQITHLNSFYDIVQKRKINTVLHCGDLVEGERIYRGQEYEVFCHGADAQVQYAVNNYPKRKGIVTKMISGNHDLAFFKTSGVDVVQHVAEQRDDIEYLGANLAFIHFQGIVIALMHGTSGLSYARSYKIQKIVEQMPSDAKSDLLFLGHYHVPVHVPGYRNVEAVQMNCFQAQTPYLVAKGLHPVLGGLIVTIQVDKKKLASVQYEWIPFYDTVNGDY